MVSRRRITEQDLLVTEALIGESYSRLKTSVVQAPSRALGTVGGTIRRHPFAAAAVAIGGGIAAYVIVSRMLSSVEVEQKKERSPPDRMMEIMSMVLPLAAPHIASNIQKYIGRILSGERD